MIGVFDCLGQIGINDTLSATAALDPRLDVELDVVMIDLPELRDHFETVCLEPPRSRNRDWMIKKIAWRLQANEQGGLPERVRQRALAMADDADLRKRPPQSFDGKLSWVPLVDRDLANRQKGSGDQLVGSLRVILCGQ